MSDTSTVSYLFEGDYVAQPDQQDAQEVTISALIASAIPVEPPASWFTDPKLTGPCAITVEDTGRVYGHCAAWHVSHIGMSTLIRGGSGPTDHSVGCPRRARST